MITSVITPPEAMSEKELSLNVPLALKNAAPMSEALGTPNKASSTSSQEVFSGYLSSVRSSNSSAASSRAQSPIKDQASTPGTPASIPDFSSDANISTDPQRKVRFYQTHQDEYLSLIEPNPVSPPRYESLPPGGCPRYPIADIHDSPADPPAYAPAIYRIGMVSRKLEWLTPYEPSPSRAWRSVIMELNSTQLNFYQIPNTLESHLQAFKPTLPSVDRTYSESEEKDIKDIKSKLTSDGDLQFYKYCQRLNLLSEPLLVNIMDEDLERIQRKLNSKRLVRSYSLQHARIGLATDYKKKPNVLRLRIESEQILIHFPTTRALISWNMSIGIGKDIALDLNERELPRYRTVPRRRRRQAASSSDRFLPNPIATTGSFTLLLMADSSRQRSGSELSRFKGKLQKLKSKLSSSSRADTKAKSSTRARSNTATITTNRIGSVRLPNLEITRSNSVPNFLIFADMTLETQAEDAANSNYYLDDDDDDYYYEEDNYEIIPERIRSARHASVATSNPISSPVPKKTIALIVPILENMNHSGSGISMSAPVSSASTVPLSPSVRNRSNTNDYDEEDIQNMSDLHRSDDDDADDEDDEVVVVGEEEEGHDITGDGTAIQHSLELNPQVLETQEPTALCTVEDDGDIEDEIDEDKWYAGSDRFPSKRKFYRNCLRCIKPLNLQDSWIGKSVVKPTTLSPLNFAYLRNVKYNTNNNFNTTSSLGSFFSHSSSTASLVSINSVASSNGTITLAPLGSRKQKAFSFKDSTGFVLPDSALSKVPNHFLKEYFVGSHGLIPKEV